MTVAVESPIRVRNPGFAFDADEVPRHWFGGSPVATHLANAVNLLFPAGERFFVRSVRRYLDQIDDETLKAQVRAFFGQEGQHARHHDAFTEMLEAQGYQVRGFLSVYEKLAYKVLEPLSPAELRLAGTVALEHFTAILAEQALAFDTLDQAHPTVRALLRWHAAEELEHKAVAFDVLARVNPSYALRIAGLALAVTTLGGFWAAAFASLMLQERARGLSLARAVAEFREVQRERPIARTVFAAGIRSYLARGFHPNQRDTDGLAQRYLRTVGLA